MNPIYISGLGIVLSGFIIFNSKSAPRNVGFLTSGFVSGIFLYSQLLPYFDPNFKIFGVLAALLIAIGVLVGGVIGILLPKISLGLSTGFMLALFVDMLLTPMLSVSSQTNHMMLLLCIVFLSAGCYTAHNFERHTYTMRSAISSGLILSMSIDYSISKGLFCSILETMRVNQESTLRNASTSLESCDALSVSKGYVSFMIALWTLTSIFSFVVELFQSGSIKQFISRLSARSHRGYTLVSTTEPKATHPIVKKRAVQRTFSYPDTLEFNYFDPDNIPEVMLSYGEIIFSVVQSLASQFGFQVDNSRNQSEHLLMMLTNEAEEHDTDILPATLRLHNKLFGNYRNWCARMGTNPLLMTILTKSNSFEHAIEDMLVWLLIWGEAANLRHLPECICFLFHKIMREHVGQMQKANGHIVPRHSSNHFAGTVAYPGYFLDMVITPIYEVMAEALVKSVDHTEKKTYDDFNEFFWSPNCLRYRITEKNVLLSAEDVAEAGGIHVSQALRNIQQSSNNPMGEALDVASGLANASKTYLEKRSWLHPLFSMHRIFEWHVITFTILMAWSFSNSLVWTFAFTFQVVSFIFWEITFFSLLWTCLEVWTLFPTVNISDPSRFGFLVRLILGLIILSYQTVYYHWSFLTNPENSVLTACTFFNSGSAGFWWWQYVWLSLISSSIYILESIICWFPSINSYILCWNNDVLQAFLGICYPFSQLYVGKKVHVSQKEVFSYIFFWLTLIAYKLWFGYRYVVYPVTVPTLELYDDYMNFEKLSFLKTSTLIFVWWFPHFLVYIIDLSIWYAVWSSVVGGFIAIVDRQGAVRDGTTFRSHFMRAPLAFCQKLMPSSTAVNQKSSRQNASTASLTNLMMAMKPNTPENADNETYNKQSSKYFGSTAKQSSRAVSTADLQNMVELIPIKSPNKKRFGVDSEEASIPNSRSITYQTPLSEVLDIKSQRWVIFAKVWNELISKMRLTDLINDEEKEMFYFTFFNWLTKPVYLPLYQTAGCIAVASLAFKDAYLDYTNEPESSKKMIILETFSKKMEGAMKEAVSEAWELAVWVLEKVLGPTHRSDIETMITFTSRWATSNDIFSRFKADNTVALVSHLSSVVAVLRGAIGKRKTNPVVTPEVLKKHQDKFPIDVFQQKQNKGALGMSRSISHGFLSALNSEPAATTNGDVSQEVQKTTSDETSHNPAAQKNNAPKSLAKMQPFRKNAPLIDLIRDKIRDDLRSFFTVLRSAFKMITMSNEGQDLLDRIIFLMSHETGFFWSDIYSSIQIDELASDPRSINVITKLDGLLRLRLTQAELKSKEAQRRLNFFLNSLFMDIPNIPSARFCKDYTCITPYYSEDILLTKADLQSKNSDGVSTLLYLTTLYKDDWINFLERRAIKDDEQLIWTAKHLQELRMWASLRAQTLFRTVEGMMQSEAAIKLLAELEQYSAAEVDLISKLKFQYVVSCQVYGNFKKASDTKADDIEYLMTRYPNLRVAYIDSFRVNREGDMVYYSVLVKSDVPSVTSSPRFNASSGADKGKDSLVKEVFRIKLPGNPVLGEGKPENQNHALIFTRGRYLQAIDMNQDGYFEEALKMRNLLEEFKSGISILGFKEHIFTGSVSSVANYMALQELSFVSLGQRVLNNPLRIRQHYGHPDLFNKMFVMTLGGMSKASRGINLSEDVFAGFNATIRGQTVGFKEYVVVGKGRDVGLQQTYKFEAKLSQGNAEQSLSRDMSRICDRLDFFRLMSFYYGGIGHYMANTMVMFTLVIVVYTMLALAVYNEEGVNGRPMHPEGILQLLMAGMGLLQTMPLAVTLTVEKGFIGSMSEIGYMFLSGGPLYFIFHIQTKCYYFQQTLMAGGAMYRPTGRGFVIRHSPFDENFRFFAMSHIYLGFELMVALILFAVYTKSKQYSGLTWSLWLTVVSFLLGPFWFNPLSFDWNRLKEDYVLWIRWMLEVGGNAEQSWDAWWKEENAFFHKLGTSWKVFLIIQKCALWLFISNGLIGTKIFKDQDEQIMIGEVILLFAVFLIGNFTISKFERYVSYAVRRFSSLVLSTVVLVTTLYLIASHGQYVRYSVAVYYFFSAITFLCLVLRANNMVIYVYKLHDYLVGHIIFLLLGFLAVIQLGYFQTWLLYHNALSSGVEIEDILKYARKTKQRASDETDLIVELKAQVAQHERTILQLMAHQIQSTPPGLTVNEKTSLIAPSPRKSATSTSNPTTSSHYGAMNNTIDLTAAVPNMNRNGSNTKIPSPIVIGNSPGSLVSDDSMIKKSMHSSLNENGVLSNSSSHNGSIHFTKAANEQDFKVAPLSSQNLSIVKPTPISFPTASGGLPPLHPVVDMQVPMVPRVSSSQSSNKTSSQSMEHGTIAPNVNSWEASMASSINQVKGNTVQPVPSVNFVFQQPTEFPSRGN